MSVFGSNGPHCPASTTSASRAPRFMHHPPLAHTVRPWLTSMVISAYQNTTCRKTEIWTNVNNFLEVGSISSPILPEGLDGDGDAESIVDSTGKVFVLIHSSLSYFFSPSPSLSGQSGGSMRGQFADSFTFLPIDARGTLPR